MATPGSGDSELGQQLERVEAKLAEAEAAKSKDKMVSRAFLVVNTIVIIILLVVLLQPFYSAYQDPTPFRDAFQKGLEERTIPEAQRQLQLFAQEDVPEIVDSLENVGEEQGPIVAQKLDEEFRKLSDEVLMMVKTNYDDFLRDFQAQQVQEIKQRFPQLRDDDKAAEIAERLAVTVENVSERIVDELLADHYRALTDLEANFKNIDTPEEIDKMTRAELEEYVSMLMFDLIDASIEFDTETGTICITVPQPAMALTSY